MGEWIVTNGLGGYASLTQSNSNTRKYHGLLISSLEPPTKRWVFVSNVKDRIKIKNDLLNLEDCPNKRFTFNYFPTFIYKFNGITLKKTVFMQHEKNTTILKYKINTDKPVSLCHTPLITSRHFYNVIEPRSLSIFTKSIRNGTVSTPSNNEAELKIILKDSQYLSNESWVEQRYPKDRDRKDSWIDASIKIGDFIKEVTEPYEYYMILTIEKDSNLDPAFAYREEIQRIKNLLQESKLPPRLNKLVLSSDHFIVNRGKRKSIIAGYHWFSDWGRDTLISLPGLTLVTKRYNIAKQILLNLKEYCRNGLIPNAYMDRDSEAIYNTVDASLWYIDRVYQYLKYTNDLMFLENIWNTLSSIIGSYIDGTDYGIHMDNDFLISHMEGLTWMDIRIGEYYPTPRAKKAVEIQALWYNALRIMAILADIIKKNDQYSILADKVKQNFTHQYHQQYDVIDIKDISCRPNQILLVSLDFSMIDNQLQEKIVRTIQEKLMAVVGIRTLSPDDPRYIGTYIGNHNKDLAYHNGIAWPWLMGPFIKSFIKIKKYKKRWREYAFHTFLKPLIDTMGENWDGSIPEIFDGDPPYIPRGCITQAWNVAEILRTLVEDIDGTHPKYEYG